jgi:hypothetical protein
VCVDDSQWRRLPLPKSISDAPYQSIEGLFMYDQLLHVLIEKREGKTALQIYDPGTLALVSPPPLVYRESAHRAVLWVCAWWSHKATGKWDGPITIKKKMWCTSLTRCGSKVYPACLGDQHGPSSLLTISLLGSPPKVYSVDSWDGAVNVLDLGTTPPHTHTYHTPHTPPHIHTHDSQLC